MDKLKELIKLCECGVSLDINGHKDFYQSVKDRLQECEERDYEIPTELYEGMFQMDTIIELTFYPDTPVGFYTIWHYDLDMALDKALNCIKEERGTK